MIDNTINDGKTIAGGGKDAITSSGSWGRARRKFSCNGQ